MSRKCVHRDRKKMAFKHRWPLVEVYCNVLGLGVLTFEIFWNKSGEAKKLEGQTLFEAGGYLIFQISTSK